MRRIGPEAMVDEIAASLSEPGAEALDALLAEPDAIMDLERTVQAAISMLRVRELRVRSAEVQRLMTLASDEEKNQLIREKQSIQKELQSLGAGWNPVRKTS